MTPKPSSAGRPAKQLDAADRMRLAAQAEVIQPADPRRIAASIAMFDLLAEHWSLRGGERETLLGGISKSTWSEWRGRPAFARIKSDTRERIANLFAIDLNAHSLFAPEFADRWVREPNAAFQGESPMSTMLRGKVEDVITVRRYLERIRTSSPAERSRPRSAALAEASAVSCLPGEAVELGDDDAAPAALQNVYAAYAQELHRALAAYEQTARQLSGLLKARGERDAAEALFSESMAVLERNAGRRK